MNRYEHTFFSCSSLHANHESQNLTFSSGLDLYTSSDHLPRALYDPVKGTSYKVDETAWQDALNTKKARWDWLDEQITVSDLQRYTDGQRQRGVKCAYSGVFGCELKDSVNKFSSTSDQIHRPEHQIFSLAMVGGGRVFGEAHLHGMFTPLL